MVDARQIPIVSATLADGRAILYYDELSGRNHSQVDGRDLEASASVPELRFDPLQDEWVIIASHRQERTHLPPPDECPLCPSTTEKATEIPSPAYDVVVFENRFPSLTAQLVDATGTDLLRVANGVGRCEVICFSSDHKASFSQLSDHRLSTIAESIVDRTRELSKLPGVEYVLVFENRGSEVGVTLHHPHGQIYGYPFIPPRPLRALQSAARFESAGAGCLFCAILEAELDDGRRIVARRDGFVAYVPSAARWPYEVHISPVEHVADLEGLSSEKRLDLLRLQADVIEGFDGLFGEPMPYLATLFQAPVTDMRELAHLRVEIVSPRRAAGKLKYLAASESAAGAFVNDVVPERAAAELRVSVANHSRGAKHA